MRDYGKSKDSLNFSLFKKTVGNPVQERKMSHASNTAKKAARFRPRATVETVSETGGGRGEVGAWPGSPDTSDLEDTPLNPAPAAPAPPASPAKLRWKKVTKNLDTDSKKKEVSIKLF